MKLEDEMELPRIRWENYKHSAKAGIGKATVKFSGRKEAAIGANAEYQIVAGEKENIQVLIYGGKPCLPHFLPTTMQILVATDD